MKLEFYGHSAHGRVPPKISNTLISDVVTAANGQWLYILASLSIDVPTSKRHGPCPICGGKDRFRFDDKERRGTWFCNQCGAGDGLSLVTKVMNVPVKQAALSLASVLGLSTTVDNREIQRYDIERRKLEAAAWQVEEQNKEASQKKAAAELANLMADEAKIVDCADHPYLRRKGYAGFPVFTLSRNYHHEANGKRYTYRAGSLLHAIRDDSQWKIIGAELVRADGGKTCLAGGSKAGAFVVKPRNLNHRDDCLPCRVFVCEGVATGYAIRELLGGDVYGFAGLSKVGLVRAAGMACKAFPSAQIVVCGDHGAELEAEQAALAVKGTVSIPPEGYGDWDDYRREVTA